MNPPFDPQTATSGAYMSYDPLEYGEWLTQDRHGWYWIVQPNGDKHGPHASRQDAKLDHKRRHQSTSTATGSKPADSATSNPSSPTTSYAYSQTPTPPAAPSSPATPSPAPSPPGKRPTKRPTPPRPTSDGTKTSSSANNHERGWVQIGPVLLPCTLVRSHHGGDDRYVAHAQGFHGAASDTKAGATTSLAHKLATHRRH